MQAFLEYFLLEGEYMLRLVFAALCGGVIGYERQNRHKEAGVRTHLIVSLASSLMMLVSKYGFDDVLGESVKLDPSRVAAGIVSGIGFLGAGIILVRSRAVIGLTTAAGIWATVGVGMALGAGMYTIGIASTVLIIVLQIVLHERLQRHVMDRIELRVENRGEVLRDIRDKLKASEVDVLDLKMKKQDDGLLELDLYVRFDGSCDHLAVADMFRSEAYVQYMEV